MKDRTSLNFAWGGMKYFIRKRWLVIFSAGFLSFAACYYTARIRGIPVPTVQDEFSYLLAADTFSKGRLTNPTHPMWRHFETYHVLEKPVYMSYYFPIQGLIMALGKVSFGHPIYGIWLSNALMVMAICWMLYGWVPPRWAVAGTGVAIIQFGFLTYWAQSYWGGSNAAMGGALVYGALRRIIREPRLRHSILLGCGLAVLLNTRPYEGFIVSIPALFVLIRHLFGRNRPPRCQIVKKIVIPILFILCLTAAWTGWYNQKLTGNAFLFPEQFEKARETPVPIFTFLPLRPDPECSHPRCVYNQELAKKIYFTKQTLLGFFLLAIIGLLKFADVYLLSFFIIPVFLSRKFILRNAWVRFATAVAFAVAVADCFLNFEVQGHYAAPATSLVIILIIQGLRIIFPFKLKGTPWGKLFVLSLFPAAFLCQIIHTSWHAEVKQSDPFWGYAFRRHEIINQLKKDGQKHLIVVRYAPDHHPREEWVYNEADIDQATVVWARELGHEQDKKLFHYFQDRQIWLVEADTEKRKLIPYPDSF